MSTVEDETIKIKAQTTLIPDDLLFFIHQLSITERYLKKI